MPELSALHVTREAVFASFRDLFIVVWRTQTTVPLVRTMGGDVERFAATQPNGISMVVIVEEHCAMPDGPTRALMAKDMKRHESFTRQMALVYEGSGFRAAALRSIVAGLHVISTQRVKTTVLSTAADAVDWLAWQRGSSASASEMLEAIVQARATSSSP
ncbi:MAG TPA: hypothetical protein VLM85_30545 [Polyangiaceae bacterium]|nr:hypothetical protein [Polyangiaceae bacterium]